MIARQDTLLSRQARVSASVPGNQRPVLSQIDQLPTEMKVALLAAMPDLDTLRNLTLAVPGYFTAYLGGKRAILSHVLNSGLSQEMLIDVCALQDTLLFDPSSSWRLEGKKFLKKYAADRSVGVILSSQDEATLCDIATRHLRMQRLVSEYSSLAISSRPNTLGDSHQLLRDTAPLTPVENTRFLRAFYRFEIICRVFGRQYPLKAGEFLHHQHRAHDLQPSELLGTFTQWEIAELNCVRQHIQDYYYRLLQRHSKQLGVKFGESKYAACERVITGIPPAFRQHLFGYESIWYKGAAEHCAALGLDLFTKILDAESDQEIIDLLKTDAFHTGVRCESLMSTLSRDSTHRGLNRGRGVIALDEEFSNSNASVDDAGAPNAGLTWARDPSRCEPFSWNEQPNQEWLFSWAYAMWDRERLDKWGILRSDHESFRNIIKEFEKARRGRVDTS